MIQAIFGKKGSGKTKRIIDLANDALKDHKGSVVFIDDDTRYMFDLRHEIRFVNAGEFGVKGKEMFMGFLCGLLSQNFDVSVVFIDAFLKLVNADIAELEPVFDTLVSLSEKYSLDFVLSISEDEAAAPAFMKKYAI